MFQPRLDFKDKKRKRSINKALLVEIRENWRGFLEEFNLSTKTYVKGTPLKMSNNFRRGRLYKRNP